MSNNKNQNSEASKYIIHIIPNIASLGNLISGFIALTLILNNQILYATKFFLLAVLLDGIDGKLAKLREEESEFGIQLDSLSDAISFGFVPSVYLFIYSGGSLSVYTLIPILFVSISILRLARFNISPKNGFRGVPTTCAGLLLVAFLYLEPQIYISLIVASILSILMISEIKYPRLSGGKSLIAGIPLALTIITTEPIFSIMITLTIFLATLYITLGSVLKWKLMK